MELTFKQAKIIRKSAESFHQKYIKEESDMKKALKQFEDITISYDLDDGDDSLCLLVYNKEQDRYEIKLRDKMENKPLNFTLAHELGHIMLHNERLMHGENFNRGGYGYNPESVDEKEADQYAAELLMPYDKCVEILKENEDRINDSANKICKSFNVSFSAAKTRAILVRSEELLNE